MKTLRFLIVILGLVLIFGPELMAFTLEQIDPYPLDGTRKVPDFTGNPGDSITLGTDEIIDILMLCDGYLAADADSFFARCTTLYNNIMVVRPYTYYKQAFRVRALFEESTARCDGPEDSLRNSYYAVKLDSDRKTSSSGWTSGSTGKDSVFRARLYQSIDDLPAPKVTTRHPSTLDNSVDGSNLISAMASTYENLYICMFLRKGDGTDSTVSGRAFRVKDLTTDKYIKIGMGTNEIHEFGHTFGYLRDEYIDNRDAASTGSNPHDDSLSIFNLSNYAYSKRRNEQLWQHLAPGSQYNPDVFSLVGNLFKGGVNEDSVWHSEYKCLMNGGHVNYVCNDEAGEPEIDLRDKRHMCFWCEELVAVRIMQRTGQFGTSSSASVNDSGIAWWSNWVSTGRDQYFTYFDIPGRIEQRNKCYGLWDGEGCNSCEGACDEDDLPDCLPNCGIRENGYAIYIDEGSGSDTDEGTKEEPKGTLDHAIVTANATLSDAKLVLVKPGTYSGSWFWDTPVTITTEGCDTVVIGK
ncbi:MAG: M64 family metallo-endopeptidase [candidate division Zixibacteria bacterium]|nr:M64 family metallo-endopeptidase [candidate division Zixibacteria bacterium]MDH3936487.1 M64 family metallo-endopeptidase [candidate division Zixibacteria bacterium]MDH4034364.1 M64 family metallo-endopeptidase [candidate division Zixibacteria bacterium]